MVLQLSYAHRTVSHALAALGSLHESLDLMYEERTAHAKRQWYFSLQQCNKAIRLLTHQASSPPPIEVILTSCILFTAFENMTNHCETALDHVRSGMKVLRQRETSAIAVDQTTSECELINDQLAPMFSRLSTSISDIGAGTDLFSAERRLLESAVGQKSHFHLPKMFVGLDDARECLHAILDEAFRDLGSLADGPDTSSAAEKVLEYKRLLKKWRLSFEFYFDSRKASLYDVRGQCKDIQMIREMKLLKIHSLFACVLILTEPFGDETLFDEHVDEFNQIVHLCQEVIEEEDPNKLPLRGSPCARLSFSFDLCLIPPLWLVGSRCRDPAVRRKAIKLLYYSRRCEGVWSSFIFAMILEKVVEIEEAGLQGIHNSHDVPAACRIRLLETRYHPSSVGDTYMQVEPYTGVPGPSSQPAIILRWVRSPFDEVEGPVEQANFPLAESAAREPDHDAFSHLALHLPDAQVQAVVMKQLRKGGDETAEERLTTGGRFDLPRTNVLSYGLKRFQHNTMIGEIRYRRTG